MDCMNVKFDEGAHWNWNQPKVEALENTQIVRDIP